MGEFIAALTRLDVSPLIAILLVALLAALRIIGRGFSNRFDCLEARVAQLEHDKHRHDTSLAVIKTRLDIVEDDHS